jgi:phosphoribosylformylglycinamidine (FGAM) synthase-like amidotransferase family enzyme
MITDSDLPPHGIFTYESFNYLIYAGGFGYGATIGRGSDTLFLIKPPVFPTLNHCN